MNNVNPVFNRYVFFKPLITDILILVTSPVRPSINRLDLVRSLGNNIFNDRLEIQTGFHRFRTMTITKKVQLMFVNRKPTIVRLPVDKVDNEIVKNDIRF